MNRILLRNSCIVIRNYTLGESQELERNFMIWNPLTHKYDTMGMYYDSENRMLYIPRGLDLFKIKRYLGETNHDVDRPNKYEHVDFLMKYGPRDENQKETLRFMCGVNEYEENCYQPQLSVNLNTGVG